MTGGGGVRVRREESGGWGEGVELGWAGSGRGSRGIVGVGRGRRGGWWRESLGVGGGRAGGGGEGLGVDGVGGGRRGGHGGGRIRGVGGGQGGQGGQGWARVQLTFGHSTSSAASQLVPSPALLGRPASRSGHPSTSLRSDPTWAVEVSRGSA